MGYGTICLYMKRPCVVLGFVGSTLDSGSSAARWQRWRPSVAVCRHPELPVSRLELLVSPRAERVAAQVQSDLAEVAPNTEVALHPLVVSDPWDFSEMYTVLADFAERYPWRPEREDYYVHLTTGTHVAQICWFLLCETRLVPAKILQSSPGHAGQRGPLGRIDVIDLDLAKYAQLAARFRARRAHGESLLKAGIATRNPAFNELIERLEQVATRTRDPLLITGETGTGKTALCQRLFELRRTRQRLTGELVSVNCATLRGDTAASALFGHARGAFTGAADARAGFLRKADKGMLFLDEIGELGADEQAMLLRAIEDKRFYPVGADREIASDFQLVAGTNRDLTGEVRAGRFREDLLARLSLWVFELPALRSRPEDLPPNLDYELDRLALELGHPVTFAPKARTAFLRFAERAPWPANFRELGAAVRRLATLADGGRIEEPLVADEIARLQAGWARSAESEPAPAGEGDLPLVRRLLGEGRAAELDRFELVQLAAVLRTCAEAPSLSAAGRLLFAQSLRGRQSRNDADRLRKYLARFGLSFDEVARARPASR